MGFWHERFNFINIEISPQVSLFFTQNNHNNHMHEDISRPFYILTVNSFMNFNGSAEVYFSPHMEMAAIRNS